MKSFIFTAFLLVGISLKSISQLTSTNLPIVILTSTSAINDTQKQANLKIIDNLSGTNTPLDAPKFNGTIGLKVRGSLSTPKLNYSVETWSAPFTSLDTSLLNMPSENDWVLLGSYVDRSLMRNVLSNSLHEKMGRYAPRFKYCELIIDNQYKGIYLFGEKIKRDTARVDIANLKVIDNAGDQLTGGYIFTIDNGNTGGWTSQITPPFGTASQTIDFLYDTPDAATITNAQQNYIKSYVDSFETALNSANFQDTIVGWRKFGAQNSFIDFMIINELNKDFEAYRKNTYIYKDKLGKLKPGPLWGNEIAWKNTVDCASDIDTGWAYNSGSVCTTNSKLAPFWWSKLSSDTLYMKELKCRYTEYRKAGNLLDTAKIFYIMDSISTKLNANGAITRNFTQWPIWGTPLVNEPLPMATNYSQEIANMKSFIRKRITWLDSKWFSTNCVYPASVSSSNFENNIQIYPNPSSSLVTINLNKEFNSNYSVKVFSIDGKVLKTLKSKNAISTIDISAFTDGIYFVEIKSGNNKLVRKIIKN